MKKKKTWVWSGHAKEQQEIILKALRKSKHEMTQRQIGKATGLSKNTVSKYMLELKKNRKVIERELATCLLYQIKRK